MTLAERHMIKQINHLPVPPHGPHIGMGSSQRTATQDGSWKHKSRSGEHEQEGESDREASESSP